MHSNASTAVYWRVDLSTRADVLTLLAQVGQLPIRPLAGADIRSGTSLFFKDPVLSAPLLLLLRPLGGQQVPAGTVSCGVWAEPQLLRRALDDRPPAEVRPAWSPRSPAPRPTGHQLAEPDEAERRAALEGNAPGRRSPHRRAVPRDDAAHRVLVGQMEVV